jgi:hypothetical protein
LEALAQEENPGFVELRSAGRCYDPGPYHGPVLLVRRALSGRQRPDLGWAPVVRNLNVLEMQGSHVGFFFEPQVTHLAEAVSERLRGVVRSRAFVANG